MVKINQFVFLTGISLVIVLTGFLSPRITKLISNKVPIRFIKLSLNEISSDIFRLIISEGIALFIVGNLSIWFNLPNKISSNILINIGAVYLAGVTFAFISVISDEMKTKVIASDMSDKDRSISLTLIPITGSIIRYLCLIGFIVFCIHIWGIDITPILTGTAFLLAILGIAGQAIIQDILGFVSLMIDRPFYVGSEIEWTFDGYTERGIIEEITLRNTIIKTEQGYKFYQPNRNANNFRVWRK